jgi:hypothetical protein
VNESLRRRHLKSSIASMTWMSLARLILSEEVDFYEGLLQFSGENIWLVFVFQLHSFYPILSTLLRELLFYSPEPFECLNLR